MNTKQPEALTLAQKLENAPAWESQSPTIYGWNDSGETLADAAAELRRLHSDYETLLCKLQTLEKLGVACDDVQLLRLGYAAARQEIESLKAKNLELERVCDATYVTQGADAYNHACSMMEQYQAERKAARKEVGTESSLCDGISWLYTRIASLESQLEAVGTGGWMRNGALLYRLTDERRPANFDEIRVTMANGSRDISQTSSRAERLLVMLSAPQALGAACGDVQPYEQQAMGLCHVCGWKGVIDYPDGPVCVACEHDKTLSPQPTAQAALAGMEPVATVTCEGVMGVSFTSSSTYGCDLAVGTKLYTESQVQAMLAGAPTPPLTNIGDKP